MNAIPLNKNVERPGLSISLDSSAATPYYRQIYERFREAIARGLLRPGDRIPSVRALMRETGLARGTVDAAYALLAAEGYIQARGQAGTVITPTLQPRVAVIQTAATGSTPSLASSFRPESIRPFQMGLPALDAFPRKMWARIAARCARSMQPADMVHPTVRGLPELRLEIASYLQVSRGIRCSPEQVFVTSGHRHTLSLVMRALIEAGDHVLVEDPGYPPSREVLRLMGIAPVPVAVDAEGMVVASGIDRAPQARAAIVTPAHQSPLGMSLSLPRRHALLDWARRNRTWIVEDDYDGEYRYISRPLPALASLDRNGRVLYAGTFSKVLFPGLRLAYLVVPELQVGRVDRVAQTFTDGCPELTQAIVATFMREGHFARHIQRMRKLYAERRAATAAGLEKVLGKHIRIDTQPGGMHLILRLPGPLSDRELVARMQAAGLYAEALADWAMRRKRDAGVLVGFTNVTTPSMVEALGRRILSLL
jgi:GntR family transcriptional regulator/MocR family aminotransferase